MDADDTLQHMMDRDQRQSLVVGCQAQRFGGAGGLCGDGARRQDRAACGSSHGGGRDNESGRIGITMRKCGCIRAGFEFGQWHRRIRSAAIVPALVHHDDGLQCRTTRTHRSRFIQLHIARDEDDPRFRFVEYARQFVDIALRVEAGGDAACGHDREISQHPFGAVVADDARDVAVLQADAAQALRDGRDARRHCLGADRLPDAVALPAHRDLRAALLERVQHGCVIAWHGLARDRDRIP